MRRKGRKEGVCSVMNDGDPNDDDDDDDDDDDVMMINIDGYVVINIDGCMILFLLHYHTIIIHNP